MIGMCLPGSIPRTRRCIVVEAWTRCAPGPPTVARSRGSPQPPPVAVSDAERATNALHQAAHHSDGPIPAPDSGWQRVPEAAAHCCSVGPRCEPEACAPRQSAPAKGALDPARAVLAPNTPAVCLQMLSDRGASGSHCFWRAAWSACGEIFFIFDKNPPFLRASAIRLCHNSCRVIVRRPDPKNIAVPAMTTLQ